MAICILYIDLKLCSVFLPFRRCSIGFVIAMCYFRQNIIEFKQIDDSSIFFFFFALLVYRRCAGTTNGNATSKPFFYIDIFLTAFYYAKFAYHFTFQRISLHFTQLTQRIFVHTIPVSFGKTLVRSSFVCFMQQVSERASSVFLYSKHKKIRFGSQLRGRKEISMLLFALDFHLSSFNNRIVMISTVLRASHHGFWVYQAPIDLKWFLICMRLKCKFDFSSVPFHFDGFFLRAMYFLFSIIIDGHFIEWSQAKKEEQQQKKNKLNCWNGSTSASSKWQRYCEKLMIDSQIGKKKTSEEHMLISLLWKGLAYFLIALEYRDIWIWERRIWNQVNAQKSVQVFNIQRFTSFNDLARCFWHQVSRMRNDKNCIEQRWI